MSYGWGPSYGDPSHPTTGELPKVGDGRRGTDEMRTVQIDAVTDPNIPRVGYGGTDDFARVGDGQRGTVGGLTVQIDRVQDPEARRPAGDTQLLPRISPKPRPEEAVPAAAKQPEPSASRNMPVLRRQMGPDWTQMPLRLLAAAVVTLAVLGVSAASLLYIADWINP
ncbi:hypothetical protein [Glycomyces arizonensis]|uniref:hypothetical protein n=1 Tax=Glycomyces arizonensis TaxID=256035 RepID=UPI000402FC2B|nr:hypothetical protein [Glycomyces arizonensis]